MENFSAAGISTMKKSRKGRKKILKIMPKLRRIASGIIRTYCKEAFTFGKKEHSR